MDINMSNTNFYKKENWVYLSPNQEDENGIKVFYDDGSLINPTMDMATYYENYMKDIAGKNNLAALDYLAGSVDFFYLIKKQNIFKINTLFHIN